MTDQDNQPSSKGKFIWLRVHELSFSHRNHKIILGERDCNQNQRCISRVLFLLKQH